MLTKQCSPEEDFNNHIDKDDLKLSNSHLLPDSSSSRENREQMGHGGRHGVFMRAQQHAFQLIKADLDMATAITAACNQQRETPSP